MGVSFKKTVQEGRIRALIKRNSPIIENIKKMNKYKASLNTLSPIVSHVMNERRKKAMKRQYSIMLKSKTNAKYSN